MQFVPDFPHDTEFRKLLTRRSDVDLTVAALELARDADANLDFQPTLDWIAARAAELSPQVARSRSDREALEALGECLAGRYEIFGDQECYGIAESSFINRVIESRRGLPISLTILYMAVAERLQLPLEGVSTPMHFIARYDSATGPLFLDAFHRGRVMERAECINHLYELCHVPKSDIRHALKPVDPRTIIIRMLNNLKALYAHQENWPAAWTIQSRLTSLQPTSYSERRDFAVVSMKAAKSALAIELLQQCLRNCPPEEIPLLEQHLAAAQSQLAQWN